MVLYFGCCTNKDYVMVNNAIFVDNEGKEYCVDREWTYYTNEEGELSMDWGGLYLWDGEDEHEITEELAMKLDFDHLELEDDADEDYVCDVKEWGWGF